MSITIEPKKHEIGIVARYCDNRFQQRYNPIILSYRTVNFNYNKIVDTDKIINKDKNCNINGVVSRKSLNFIYITPESRKYQISNV